MTYDSPSSQWHTQFEFLQSAGNETSIGQHSGNTTLAGAFEQKADRHTRRLLSPAEECGNSRATPPTVGHPRGRVQAHRGCPRRGAYCCLAVDVRSVTIANGETYQDFPYKCPRSCGGAHDYVQLFRHLNMGKGTRNVRAHLRGAQAWRPRSRAPKAYCHGWPAQPAE